MSSEGITSQEPQRGALPSFDKGIVGDVMRTGVMTASPDAPLRDIAATMADYRVHSVVITDLELGSGEQRYQGFFEELARRFPGRGVYDRGYKEDLSHQIEARRALMAEVRAWVTGAG